MATENKSTEQFEDPYFTAQTESNTINFDVVLWLFRILKYWYLFIIAIVICLSAAFFKNKYWSGNYSIQALIMLEDRGNTGIVNAVPLGTILRNDVNQQILLGSYGMTERTVNRLPEKMHVDYFQQTRFRRTPRYSDTPVRLDSLNCRDAVYSYIFDLSPLDDEYCLISCTISETESLNFKAKYNEYLKTDMFEAYIAQTDNFQKDFSPLKFYFLSDQQLINSYNGRVKSGLKEDNGSAMELSMGGPDAFRDLDYLNTLLDEFQDYNLVLKNKQADLTIGFLTKQIAIINDSLQNARLRLDNFQRETGVFEITSPTIRAEIKEADKEKDNLSVVEQTLLLFTQKIGETILGDSKLIPASELGLEAPSIDGLINQYNGIIEKSKYLGSKNPLYNKTIDNLNVIRNKILKELKEYQIRLQDKKDQLISKYALLDLKTDNLPPQERDLVKFQREYQVNEMYHQFLTQKRYEAQIQKASNTPDNFIWEYPRITGYPNTSGDKSKTYMFWFIVALVVPLIYIIMKEEILNNTISTKEECEKISGLPVIGTIENISNKLKYGVVLVKNFPKSSFAESFRNIRVRLAYIAKRQDKISVLVTSTEPADGKTFIAANIASVYQLTDKKVVIVDLDLRRPSVAKTLGMENSAKGVSNYLIGQVTLDEITQHHEDFGFDVIPAGTLPPNPSELIKTEKTKELIETLKLKYDYVIVDCSPVGLVSDAYILARLVDTTLFAVRRAKTNKSFFKSVIQQLRFDGIENVALIFNDVKGREGYYGTSRYYGDKTYYLRKNTYYHDDYFEN